MPHARFRLTCAGHIDLAGAGVVYTQDVATAEERGVSLGSHGPPPLTEAKAARC